LQVSRKIALSDSAKAEALADGLEVQPVNDPSEPAVIEIFNEAMRFPRK
jgi:hypothetical protein